MSYRDMYLNLKTRIEQKGFTVKAVGEKTLYDYAGMNPEAAKDFGYKIGSKEFHIDSNMDWEGKYKTLLHEWQEYQMMKDGKSYWEAHKASWY